MNGKRRKNKMARVKTLSARDCKKLEKYPNFSKTGSIKGMKKRFYGKDATLVKCGGYIYNVPKKIYDKID
jgi:hypothetical protein